MRIEILASILIASLLGLTTVYLIDVSTRGGGVSDLKPPLQPDRSIGLEGQKVSNGSQDTATTVSRGFELYSFMLALIAASTFSHIVRRRLQRF
ncbi:MAG: hypothetical protein NZ955_03325 [Candidatus Bathyarchaeota archaeon]|nr:hypothetical protein [Candidatus Bathyarchaeota archaeon]